jgi:hypothetical protein
MARLRRRSSKKMILQSGEQADETKAVGSQNDTLEKTMQTSGFLRSLSECLILLTLIAGLNLFFATPWRAVAKVDSSADPLFRIVMSDPLTPQMIEHDDLLNQTIQRNFKSQMRSVGIKMIGKVDVSVSPPFLIYAFGYWGNFCEPKHQVVEDIEIDRSINWDRLRIEAGLGLLIGLFPLFKWPAKLMRLYLNARG